MWRCGVFIYLTLTQEMFYNFVTIFLVEKRPRFIWRSRFFLKKHQQKKTFNIFLWPGSCEKYSFFNHKSILFLCGLSLFVVQRSKFFSPFIIESCTMFTTASKNTNGISESFAQYREFLQAPINCFMLKIVFNALSMVVWIFRQDDIPCQHVNKVLSLI